MYCKILQSTCGSSSLVKRKILIYMVEEYKKEGRELAELVMKNGLAVVWSFFQKWKNHKITYWSRLHKIELDLLVVSYVVLKTVKQLLESRTQYSIQLWCFLCICRRGMKLKAWIRRWSGSWAVKITLWWCTKRGWWRSMWSLTRNLGFRRSETYTFIWQFSL